MIQTQDTTVEPAHQGILEMALGMDVAASNLAAKPTHALPEFLAKILTMASDVVHVLLGMNC